MAGLSMSPFHVDSSRIGGAHGAQRHNFNLGGKAPSKETTKKPRFIPAPPKRGLGQGVMAAPQLSVSQLKQLQESFKPVIEALQLEIEAVKTEADMVSGPTLRIEPDLYKTIAIIGPYFSPQEVRSAILVDANELSNLANRLITGAVSSYLSPEQKSAVETAKTDSEKLASYMQQFDLATLSGASSLLAQEHVDSHVAGIMEGMAEAEKGIVSVEAGSVPVIEPSEGGLGIGGFIAIGTLIAVSVVISDLI